MMEHKIRLADGTLQLIKITSAYFKAWQVWKVRFEDGKVVMLFKLGSAWMQRNEDYLDAYVLNLVGVCIDKIIFKRSKLSY